MLFHLQPALIACALLAAPQATPPQAPPTDPANCHEPPPPLDGPLPMDRKSMELRAQADRIEASTAPFLGRSFIKRAEKRIDRLGADAPKPQLYQATLDLADARVWEGQLEKALTDYQHCAELANANRDSAASLIIWKRMAIACLRIGERKNCVANHNQDSCLFPLRDGAIHRDRNGSEQAAQILEQLLKSTPDDYGSMWLLNLAHMTLGSWPDGVPQEWRIPASAFASERELPRMRDIAPQLGLNFFTRSGGSCLDDFDGDGRLDLVTSSIDPRQPLRMFRQKADHTFVDVSAAVGFAGQLGGLYFLHFDANNDGRLDLLVQRGAWLTVEGQIPNSLLIQQPDGTFLDRTQEAGIEISAPSQVAVTADIDLDGDLDLFLGYESSSSANGPKFPCRLFRNRGDTTFEEVTELAGVQNNRFCKGAAFGDYDGDGLADLYVSNMRGWNRLYHNDGGCHFTDVTFEQGVAAPYDSFACWWFDYDNDGRQDLWVANYDQHPRSEMIGAY